MIPSLLYLPKMSRQALIRLAKMGPLDLAIKVLPLPPNRAGSQENQARNVHFATIRYHYRFVPPLRDGEVEDRSEERRVGKECSS